MKRWLEQQSLRGQEYALVCGLLQTWMRTPDGYLTGVMDMLMEEDLRRRLKHYLERHDRAFSTHEEADFVMVGGSSKWVD
ncbi:hypothetical protein [Corallococcus terminator]|uniref:Uncharacterized protein n=1 Tax=Corallococcus terminator TaxID=2316733 RepID=A0A3A8JTC3_9BACT|nr:hypothetical protein [Corallococcus terminator]RKG93671.1 hypothetical protein D7V88_01640 [Corallococcus terminator]